MRTGRASDCETRGNVIRCEVCVGFFPQAVEPPCPAGHVKIGDLKDCYLLTDGVVCGKCAPGYTDILGGCTTSM
jgi:hypothetical protein